MTKTIVSDVIKSMFEVGAHLGFSRSRRHPSVKPYIFGTKNKVEIIDLEKTIELLDETKAFIAKLGMEGKQVLFVGTKPEVREVVKEAALSAGAHYVTHRWIGGTLTNFSEIKKRTERFLKLTDEKEKGELIKYTKKERLLIDREIEKLEKNFGGIAGMKERPKALFVVDSREEEIAVTEAIKEGVPVIALASSDCDISRIDYPVVANDSALKSVTFFVNEITTAYKKGIADAPKKEVPSGEKEKKGE